MKAGDIPDYPLISEYNPPPWEFPRLAFWIVAVGLPLVVLSIAVVAYAEYAFPHGPEVFVGYEELCDGEGKCNEVEVFVEDTSGLNNPIWVNELRDWSRGVWLVAILAIVVVGWQAWGSGSGGNQGVAWYGLIAQIRGWLRQAGLELRTNRMRDHPLLLGQLSCPTWNNACRRYYLSGIT